MRLYSTWAKWFSWGVLERLIGCMHLFFAGYALLAWQGEQFITIHPNIQVHTWRFFDTGTLNDDVNERFDDCTFRGASKKVCSGSPSPSLRLLRLSPPKNRIQAALYVARCYFHNTSVTCEQTDVRVYSWKDGHYTVPVTAENFTVWFFSCRGRKNIWRT